MEWSKICLILALAVSVSAQANRLPCTLANVPNGLINNIESCAAYFSCVNGVAHSFNCPAGFYYDPVRQVCDLASNVACNLCPPAGVTKIRNPRSCTDYILCVHGEAHDMSCGRGTRFNGIDCALATEVNCLNEPNCPSTGVALVPNPLSCTSFYICHNGIAVEQRECLNGLEFDVFSSTCSTMAVCESQL